MNQLQESETARLLTLDLNHLRLLERLARQKWLKGRMEKVNYLIVMLARTMKEGGAS